MKAEAGVRLLALLTLASLGVGCASTGPRPVVPDPGAPPAAVTLQHGQALSREEAARFLSRFRHVYVGERHASAPHQAVQLDVVQALHDAGARVTVAVEWLPASAQPAVDAYLRGEVDEAGFLERAGWARVWGHAFESYAPLFRFARAEGLPIVALNAPPGLPSRLVRQGRQALSPEELAALPPLDTHDPVHRAWFGCLYAAAARAHGGHHGGHGLDAERIDRAYEGQLVWDETMARGVAELLASSEHAGRVIVVLAGQGHVDWALGIPRRALALSGQPFAIAAAAPRRAIDAPELRGDSGPYPRRRADLLWFPPIGFEGDDLAAILAVDPCR